MKRLWQRCVGKTVRGARCLYPAQRFSDLCAAHQPEPPPRFVEDPNSTLCLLYPLEVVRCRLPHLLSLPHPLCFYKKDDQSYAHSRHFIQIPDPTCYLEIYFPAPLCVILVSYYIPPYV
jgi:hypothetical protein